MATVAEFGSARRRPAQAPISAHPAFPAIVALWFAALLGLGSLVLPTALFERLITLTHIDSLIPSTAPPLGFTARAGIALGGSIAGALVGLWLARKVAASSEAEPKLRGFKVSAERPVRPISARDELGEEGLGSSATPSPGPLKRRALAMSEDNRRSAYLDHVPLPGQAAEQHVAYSAMADEPNEDDPQIFANDAPTEPEHEPLELTDVAAAGDDQAESDHADSAAGSGLDLLRRRIHTPQEHAMQESPMTDRPTFHPAEFDEDDGDPQEFRPIDQQEAPEELVAVREDAPPLQFAAPSQRRIDAAAFHDNDDSHEDVREHVPAAFAAEAAPKFSVVEAGGQAAADDRPIEELGLVQLAARLGASIEKRRAQLAGRNGVVPSPPPAIVSLEDADFEAAEAEDAARAIADFFGPAQDGAAAVPSAFEAADVAPARNFAQPAAAAVPEPMQDLTLDQDEDEDDAFAASLSLPLARKPAVTGPAPVVADGEGEDFAYDEDEADEGGNEEEFSSLLTMKNPFARQQEFVRVEMPESEDDTIEPTVTFPVAPVRHPDPEPIARPFDAPKNAPNPGPLPATPSVARDPGDAERNLRDALATLQRMSGAA